MEQRREDIEGGEEMMVDIGKGSQSQSQSLLKDLDTQDPIFKAPGGTRASESESVSVSRDEEEQVTEADADTTGSDKPIETLGGSEDKEEDVPKEAEMETESVSLLQEEDMEAEGLTTHEPLDVESPEADQDDDNDKEPEDEEEEEDTENLLTTNLPLGRVKKLMKICLGTNEAPDPAELEQGDTQDTDKTKKTKKTKGKGDKAVSKDTSNLIVTKEAIFLTTVATELFIAAIIQQSSRITTANKKKTMTIDHLKRALTDSECYEFLQGCFQPSIIIGD